MNLLALLIAVALFAAYRFMKKRRSGSPKDDVKINTFEEDFEMTYGTTWDAWVEVKRSVLTDDSAFISSIKSVFNDMYVTRQKIDTANRVK